MTDPKPTVLSGPVRLVIDNGEPAPPPPPPEEERPRTGGGDPPERDVELPPDCPVEPLGVTGQTYHFLDERRQYIALSAEKLGRATIEALFGRQAGKLEEWFPRKKKTADDEWIITGWRPEAAGRALKVAAAKLPVWNPLDTIRGAGAWKSDAGELILHCGDAILIGGEWKPPGRFGRHVYPASAPLPRPSDDRELSRTAGQATLNLLATWQWRRRRDRLNGSGVDVDAILLLGWIASAMLGAALTWRSMCWVTGDASTGKSTLLTEFLGGLMGAWLLTTSDASAAGIWQTLGYSALPVAFDELEAQEDPRRAQQIITLARQAASGGRIMRGGADHKSTEFTSRSSFLFSSILIPPLLNQDRSRLAILDLEDLPKDRKAPDLAKPLMLALGRALARRMVDTWPRFAERLDTWRQALIAVGHGGRGADQLGTLLACADLARNDHPPSADELAEICELLKAEDMADRDDALPDHARCLMHLLTSTLDVYRNGALSTVAEWIKSATAAQPTNTLYDKAEAEKALGNHGLKLHRDGEGEWLAVANSHQGLNKLFAGTHWAARSGASGVWMQALRRVPGAKPGNLRFNGVVARATLLLIAAVLPPSKGSGE
jgi:hypothetical protein